MHMLQKISHKVLFVITIQYYKTKKYSYTIFLNKKFYEKLQYT